MAYHNVFQHSGTASYGENISYLQGYGKDIIALIKKSIDSWYNEVSEYDYNNPGFSKATGHFTCLVWKSSTTFGFGITLNDNTNEAYISMNTFPPGNYSGQFIKNVLPPLVPNVPSIPTQVPTVPSIPTQVPTVPSIPTQVPTETNVPILPGVPTPMRIQLNNYLYKIIRANNLRYSKTSILNSLNEVIKNITNDPNF
jgi:hypothetical protein